jgi:anti-anti-sigma factor
MVAESGDRATIALIFDGTGVVRVAVAGEFDLSNAHLLGESVQWALSVPNVTSMLVDLSAMTFLDAVGISTMVFLARQIRGRGRALRIIGAAGMVAELLAVTGVADDLVGSLVVPLDPWTYAVGHTP